MSPAVSVIISTYNYGRFLAGAVESVFWQTFSDYEIIVVDDGSTDNTREVIRPYLLDPRVRYQRLVHRGQPTTKNAGIRLARAPLIAFLDADDRWLPAKLERQVALFRSDPELGVAYTRRLVIDERGRELPCRQPTLCRGHVLPQIFETNFVCFSSCMVRRGVFEEVGMFDESLELSIDYELWLRAARRFRFDFVDEPLVKYRTGHANLSRRVEERLLTVMKILQRFLDEQGGRELINPAVVRRTYGKVYNGLALIRRDRSRWAALADYWRALTQAPGYFPVWKGLGSLFVPEPLRQLYRLALGRPPDWRQPKVAKANR